MFLPVAYLFSIGEQNCKIRSLHLILTKINYCLLSGEVACVSESRNLSEDTKAQFWDLLL